MQEVRGKFQVSGKNAYETNFSILIVVEQVVLRDSTVFQEPTYCLRSDRQAKSLGKLDFWPKNSIQAFQSTNQN